MRRSRSCGRRRRCSTCSTSRSTPTSRRRRARARDLRRGSPTCSATAKRAAPTASCSPARPSGRRSRKARKGIKVPVLRIEEAMMDEAVARGGSILVVCTQKRAMPVVRGTLDAAAQARRQDADDHGALGRRRARCAQRRRHRHARPPDRRAVGGGRRFRHRSCSGMISMAPARAKMPPALAKQDADQRRGSGRAHAQADRASDDACWMTQFAARGCLLCRVIAGDRARACLRAGLLSRASRSPSWSPAPPAAASTSARA